MKIRTMAIVIIVTMLFSAITACGVVGGLPLSAARLLDLGEKYLLDMDYEQALVQFLKVIEIEPMIPRGYTGAADAYIGLEQPDNAVAILRQGLRAIPGNVEIQTMLDGLTASESTSTPEQMPDFATEETQEQTPTPEPELVSDADVITDVVTDAITDDLSVGIGIGQIAPNFTLDLRGGGSVTLWSLRGKPTFINVCTTWCPPCQDEFSEVQEVYARYGSQINVIGISIGESISDVDGYFDQFDYTYPIAYDPNNSIDPDYNIEFIPQTWVLDANGVIVDYISGSTTVDVFETSIEKALK